MGVLFEGGVYLRQYSNMDFYMSLPFRFIYLSKLGKFQQFYAARSRWGGTARTNYKGNLFLKSEKIII